MDEIKTIEAAAQAILARDPAPVVRYRLLCDVLRRSANDSDLVAARKTLNRSKWVRLLAAEQHGNGGWGRFHSANYQSTQKIPTTEAGVKRALALGLDAGHPVLRKAGHYITRILQEKIKFPDRAEKNDRWPAGVQMFAGAMLAQIQPDLPVLDNLWTNWAKIAGRTFASGRYDPDAEVAAHSDLTGAPADLGYLRINNRYAVILIGSMAGRLPEAVERTYAEWLWHKPGGLGYLDAPLHRLPEGRKGFRLDAWFTSLELLSRFPSWRRLAKTAIRWLWKQQNEAGLWDFGPRSGLSAWFPLSDNWRKKMSRQYDYSTRVLILLRKFYDNVASRAISTGENI